MDNKNGKNRFAGTSIGGGSKYIERHQEALRLERAADFDKRIAEFDAQKHTLDWARKAVDFCNREQEAGKDVADISKGVQDLPRIRREAQDIINAEDLRLQAEKEALKLQQQQLDLKNKADEDAAVSNIERLIDNISGTSRTREWLDEVQRINLMVKGLPSKVFDRVSNRFLIDGFNKEVPDLEMALELDSQILELNATRQKNKTWAQKVFALEKKLSPKYDKYMKEKNSFYTLASLASKVYYSVEIASIDAFLKKVEEGQIEQVMDDYNKVSKNVDKLRDAIYIEEYINNFESRWADAKEKADAIVKENNRIAAEQLKAQQDAIKLQEEIDIKNAQKAAKAKVNRARFLKALVILLHIAAVATVGILGVLNLSNSSGMWILTGGGAGLLCYFWFVLINPTLVREEMDFAKKLILICGLTVPILGINIAGIFVSALSLYFLPLLGLLLLIIIIEMSVFGSEEEGMLLLDISLITLAFVLLVAIGGIIGAVVCAGVLIAQGITHAVTTRMLQCGDIPMLFIAAAMMLAAAVLIWWFKWEFILVAAGLFVSGFVIGCSSEDADEMVAGYVGVGCVEIGLFLISIMITVSF